MGEYGLGNIRRIQTENLSLLLKNDELEREIKILRKQLMSMREKFDDVKHKTFESFMNLNVCPKSYKCHKAQNVEQQTDTNIREHEDTKLVETFRKSFESKL